MSSSSKQALEEANREFYAAFEHLDLQEMDKLWAQSVDVSCVHPGWDIVSGRDAVMRAWKDIFAGTEEITFRIDNPVVTVAGDAGWVVCHEVLHTTSQGSPIENILTTINTFVLEGGHWRLAHHHAAPLMAGKPRAKAPTPPRTLH